MSSPHINQFHKWETQMEQLKQKLDSKTETILRLGKDLEAAENEKHVLSARNSTLERNLQRSEQEVERLKTEQRDLKLHCDIDQQTLLKELERMKKEIASYKAENLELKAEKQDLQKDCKTFRQQIAKYEVEKIEKKELEQVRMSTDSFGKESDNSLSMYEKLYSEFKQMESDLHTVLGVKEELVKERENLVQKVERLSSELTFLLNGDTRRINEDLDTVLAENRFLKAQLSTAHEESESIKSTLAKYRSMAEAMPQNLSPALTSADNRSEPNTSVAVVNMKQIRELLTSQSIELDDSDLRAITTILLDVCNDKQMALTHQRRVNRVLGNRLHEVESHLSTLESKSSRSCSPRAEKLETTA